MKGEILDLQQIRQIQLSMMDRLDAFCTSRGIRYSLSGGSLLGAVRHHGFIPWDDDMDVLMPRPDYERFLIEFPLSGQEGCILENLRTDPDWPLSFTKLMDTGTVLVQRRNGLRRYGVFIDIFAVDGQPSDDAAMELYYRRYRHLSHELHKRAPLHRFTDKPSIKAKVVIRRCFHGPSKTVVRAIDELLASYPFESSEYAGAIMGGSGMGTHIPKTVFEHYTRLPFEDREYSCLQDYDTYLSRMYGDYMTPPPPRKRVSPHLETCYKIK